MATVIKYVGTGEFINGLPARDLDEEDWRVIGLQGRQAEVLASSLYEAVGDVGLATGRDVGIWTPLANLDLSKDVGEVLAAADLSFVEEVNDADDEALLALDGIGPKKLAEIRKAVAQSMASDIEHED